jgi:hypothetical protein
LKYMLITCSNTDPASATWANNVMQERSFIP